MVSGALSLPAQGCFSPVPHGTRPLSVTRESLALEGGPPSFAPGFSFRALLRNSATTGSRVRLPGSHRLWPPVPGKFTSPALSRPQVLQPRAHKEHGLGLGPFRSPLLRTSRLISLPPGTEMFQFPGFAFRSRGMTGTSPAGLPHSAISGSPRVCHSPELLAAYHGLHRLCVPRHPPHAFLRLTTNGSSRNTRVAIAIYLLPILIPPSR